MRSEALVYQTQGRSIKTGVIRQDHCHLTLYAGYAISSKEIKVYLFLSTGIIGLSTTSIRDIGLQRPSNINCDDVDPIHRWCSHFWTG